MISILIVEDDPTLREVLSDLLSEDFPCCAVKSVEEALQKLETGRFSIVLTDISMPGMSGLELLGCIKQKWEHIPVIMFSGIDDEEYAQGINKIGAFDYLSKPFALDQIVQSVTRAIIEHPHLSSDPFVDQDSEGSVPPREDRPAGQSTPIFASVVLGGIISFAELLEIVQRGKMCGYIELHWDNSAISRARELGRFNDASGAIDAAVLNCSGWIYLKDGLIIDAVIDESEGSEFWRGAEESLAVLVKLSTYVGDGVRAWGFSMDQMERRPTLSIRDNSAKMFDIITSDEREGDSAPFSPEPVNQPPVQAAIAVA
ncbi:MAG: response regulator [Acidobacteria bacterium]|nr:response regulator [Acidobacteriota bacterium]MCA1643519.1 response regulator [Acidobacteriota bacterium]